MRGHKKCAYDFLDHKQLRDTNDTLPLFIPEMKRHAGSGIACDSNDECSAVTFNALPNEILSHIFTTLDFLSKLSCRKVSRKFNVLVTRRIVEIPRRHSRFCTDLRLVTFPALRVLSIARQAPISRDLLLRLPNLTDLSIEGNTSFGPRVLGDMTQLESLEIRYNNNLSPIPVRRLTQLTKLSLHTTNAIVPRDRVSVLSNLSNLIVLTDFPRYMLPACSLSSLTNLEQLVVGHCHFPAGVPIDRLLNPSKLRSLGLEWGAVILGRELRKLTNLTILGLTDNTCVRNRTLTQMSHLKALRLRGSNGITDVTLARMTNVTSLDLKSNRAITDEGISPLTNLTRLDLSGTTRIDGSSFCNLTKLTNLIVRGNTTVKHPALKKAADRGATIHF